MRPMVLPAGKDFSVVVTEFLHHGEINADGSNLLVAARGQKSAPVRILQLGPGDFCRLAFQTLEREDRYEILYGGDPPKESAPPWTNRDGLLLETRRYKNCNLQQLDSVRKAYDSAKPYGSDYVENVQHSRNPFSLKVEPFLSRYSGTLHIGSAGRYGFLTSSRDCSFLLIDGKEVIAAPGRHGPLYRAKRGSRGDVQLSAGPHKFEYYHAAAGPQAIMVAAWEVSPTDPKPQPAAIPGSVFRTGSIGRVPVGSVTTRKAKLVPDFTFRIVGDVPLPENDLALVGVAFRDLSPKALTMSGRVRWDFGDGQTSDKLNPDHIYLRPGLYTVTLAARRGTRVMQTTNRIYIDRPPLTIKDRKTVHQLDDYLPKFEQYDLKRLDAGSVRQLVLAYQAKISALESPADEPPSDETEEEQPAPEDPTPYVEAAVRAGKAAFVKDSAAKGAEDLLQLARLVGPMARDRLGDSQTAARIYQAAAEKIGLGAARAECEIEAADVAINDLIDPASAKKLLDAAAEHLAGKTTGPVAARFQRVRADYLAATGKGQESRTAYIKAEKLLGVSRTFVERTTWRGAYSRSTEEFIKQRQYDRAAAQLSAWQNEFPADKMDGYLTLLYARYWAGRKKYPQAIAQAEQLQSVSPDSPYVDQILLLAAACEIQRERTDRALATLHSLVKDYPGSPLAPQARELIARLEAQQKE